MKRLATIYIFRYKLCGESWRVDVIPVSGKPSTADGLTWSEAKKIVRENVGVSIVKPERMERIDRYRSTASFSVGESDDGRRQAFRIKN